LVPVTALKVVSPAAGVIVKLASKLNVSPKFPLTD